MAKDLAIVLNNGSLNSAVTTALAAQKFRPILLFAETGATARAKGAFEQQVAHFKPYREHLVSMSFMGQFQSPSGAAAQSIDPRQGTALSPLLLDLLPLVSVGVRFAAQYQASALYTGLRVGSSADELAQATEYVQILNELVQMACGQPELEIITPLLELEPWQVVDVGFQVNAPLELGWSCIEQTAEPCGKCRGCRIRDGAFEQAGKPDPMRARK